MGRPKASLDWHGSSLVGRVAAVVSRAVDGPVVVVRAAGQSLPRLPREVEVVEDAVAGMGPLAGIAAGLAALDCRCQVAYVSAADVPFLHPNFVARVLEGCSAEFDACVPVVGGFAQPLAGGYRASVLGEVEALLDAGDRRVTLLVERCRSRLVEEAWLLGDPALAGGDPGLDSVRGVNLPADYEAALARSEPEVQVGGVRVRVSTLGAAAAAVGVGDCAGAVLNGEEVDPDPELALVAGDTVSFAGHLRFVG